MSEPVDAALTAPDDVLRCLFTVLDTLATIARRMHPPHLRQLVEALTAPADALRSAVSQGDRTHAPGTPMLAWEPVRPAVSLALQACDELAAAPAADNPMLAAYRAMRRYSGVQEMLAELAPTLPAISRHLLEPGQREDPALLRRLAAPVNPDTGVFHFNNETQGRGGFSVYVPPSYDPVRACPVVMALHGGAGHGRLFLWNWVPQARTRGFIVIAPTAIGGTWSLRRPDLDGDNLRHVLTRVAGRWRLDPRHRLLTGMSDGGTFTLLSGLDPASPFTHLAPVAAAFHPLLLSMTEPGRLTGLPIYLVHGAMDWMFPVDVARTAHRALAAAGAAVVYREVADLSHAYPCDEQGAILNWWLPPAAP